MKPLLLKVRGIVDVERQTLLRQAFVWVADGRIQGWGRQADLGVIDPALQVLEHPQSFCLPGLINSHVHLCLPSGGKPFYLKQSDQMALLTAVRNMQTELSAGITTVRDCGDQNGVLFALRQAVETDILMGPQLVLCGPPLTRAGDHAHFLGGEADGATALTRRVADRVAAGADFIKVIATGGGTPGSQPAMATYNQAELQTLVSAAHRSGKPVAAHCRGTPGIINAVAAGVDQIEHACFEQPDGRLKFDPAIAAKMGAAGMTVTPTIVLYHDARAFLEKEQTRRSLTADENAYLARLPDVIAEKNRALRGFIKAGVRCVAGNDGGLPHTGFGGLWREMAVMVNGGMTAMQAVEAATLAAAKSIGRADDIGSITAGKRADLILVGQDPTVDINTLAKVELVMLGGRIVHATHAA